MLCKKCAFKNHYKCTKLDSSVQKDQKICNKCKIRAADLFCKVHSICLCDGCCYSEHQNCASILLEDFNKFKDELISKIKKTLVQDFQVKNKEKGEQLSDVIDKIIKQLRIIRDLMSDNERIVDSFAEKQLKELEIVVKETKVKSLNELYIERCYNI